MKNIVFFTIACLLLGNSLLFAQQAQPTGRSDRNGPTDKSTKPYESTCGESAPIVMADGSTFEDEVGTWNANYYQIYLKAGHSYAVEAWHPVGPDHTSANGRPHIYLYDTDCATKLSTTDVLDMDPALSGGFADRISWTEATGGLRYLYIGNWDHVYGYYYNMRIVDTTLFSPRWSTWSGFLTQWGLYNVSNSSIPGVLTIFNAAGSTIKTVSFTVPAGRVKFFSSVPSDLNLPANSSGSVKFAYVGPAGAIQGDATIMNSTVTVLAPVKFETRDFAH